MYVNGNKYIDICHMSNIGTKQNIIYSLLYELLKYFYLIIHYIKLQTMFFYALISFTTIKLNIKI